MYWINCSDDELIEEELALCARAGLFPDGDWTDGDIHTVVGKVQESWQEPVRRLIIFDECEDEDTLRRLTYRPLLGKCYVLVSSLNTRWKTAPGTVVYPLSPLPEELGVQLLLAHKCGVDRTQARAIVTILEGMPLAIQSVGRYFALIPGVSAWTLLEELQAAWSQGSEAVPTPEQSIKLFGLLLERHLEQLREGDTEAQLAYKLLKRAIVVAPEQPIDPQLLQESLTADELVTPAAFAGALAHLVRRGLLMELSEGPEEQLSLQIHRLTAELLRGSRDHDLGHSEARVVATLIKKCEEALAGSGQARLFPLLQQFRRYLPHLHFLLIQGGTLNEQQRATIHTLLASYHRTCGRNKDAEQAVEHALDFHIRGMSHVAEQVVKGYLEAAAFARLQGDLKLVLTRLAQAQKIADAAAPDSLSVQAEVRYVLAIRTMQAEESNGPPMSEADVKRLQAAREQAIKLLTESRDLLAKASGGKTLLRATILHELGALYFQQDNLELARKNFERALEIRDELRDELTGPVSDPRQRTEYHIVGGNRFGQSTSKSS